MKDTPILFRAPMVVALLAGTKTQTRRIVKGHLAWHGCFTGDCPHEKQVECEKDLGELCPYGRPGDRLYVRESLHEVQGKWYYTADGAPLDHGRPPTDEHVEWARTRERPVCPSIHMKKWASRITLELTRIRGEYLTLVTEEDAKAEGFETRDAFLKSVRAFNNLDAKANPTVWVLEFKRVA